MLCAIRGGAALGLAVDPATSAAFRVVDRSLCVHFEAMERAHGPGGFRLLRLEDAELEGLPSLARVLRALVPVDPDAGFEFGLERLLAGVVRLCAAPQSG